MAEYVDKEDAIRAIVKTATRFCRDVELVAHIIHDVETLPAADVRPVVLCRDCLHYEIGVCLKIYDDGAASKDAWQKRKPDDFCSYGEDRNVPTNCRTDMRPASMSVANKEEI